MRYQLVRELSSETFVVQGTTGAEILFDRVKVKADLKDIFRFELHQDIQRLARDEAAVNSPGLLKYCGFERCGEHFYLVRESAVGEGLADYRPDSPEAALGVLQQLLAIMAAYHQQELVAGGFCLGQLKIGNAGKVLVQDPWVINHLSKFLSGDYDFSLPAEVVKGGEWSRLSDVFSWGELAYKLLTGHDPFAANRPEDRAAKLLEGIVTDPRIFEPRLSEKISQLIQSCLAADAKLRPHPVALAQQFNTMLADGACFASADEVKIFTERSAAHHKKQQSRERLWFWWRKHGRVATIITIGVTVLLTLMLVPKEERISEKATPWEVLNYYFTAIKTVDVSLMDETIHKAKNSLTDIMGNIHVINVSRKANRFVQGDEDENAIKVTIEGFEVTNKHETATAADYNVKYTLKFITAQEINYLAREDRFHLNPVGKKWRITRIDIYKEKRWTKKLISPASKKKIENENIEVLEP